jgi:hypothetical protein
VPCGSSLQEETIPMRTASKKTNRLRLGKLSTRRLLNEELKRLEARDVGIANGTAQAVKTIKNKRDLDVLIAQITIGAAFALTWIAVIYLLFTGKG